VFCSCRASAVNFPFTYEVLVEASAVYTVTCSQVSAQSTLHVELGELGGASYCSEACVRKIRGNVAKARGQIAHCSQIIQLKQFILLLELKTRDSHILLPQRC
jgi:hypothetical protein